MKTIDLLDEDTDLLALADAVRQSGEAIILTRGGQPLADLVPHQKSGAVLYRPPPMTDAAKAELFARADALRKTLPPTTLEEIKADIEAGRH